MTEAQTQFEILKAWGSHPRLRIWRQNVGAAMVNGRLVRFGQPGCPDILGVMSPSGRLIGVEVKSATGRQSPEQKRFEEMFRSKGAIYILARSLEDVDRVLIPLVGAR
jgi:hypothetical protein